MSDVDERSWCVEAGDAQLVNVNLARMHAQEIEARGNGWWTARSMTEEEARRFHPSRRGLASWPAAVLLERYRSEHGNRDAIRAELERRWSGRDLLPLLDEIDAAAELAQENRPDRDGVSAR